MIRETSNQACLLHDMAIVRFKYPTATDTTREALRLGMRDRAEQFHIWLMEGLLARVIEVVSRVPAALADLLPIVANPDASINVRIGASAVFERQAGSTALQALVPALGMLSMHGDARVRAEACYFLGLSGTAAATRFLEPRLDDPDAEVREIAAESLEELTKEEHPT
ncbi:MAG: HEAT repeat domain-containing protein [Gammaproteobacteria bacterium]|nr:HEAT repeat domain-containing protein [Rhodocyclaceae bacterium]MBU3909581.1 HEAT repeat domain-containing protein [Gammaproteobacteria bacterium]MBU3989167.1 HEAT repeat domain-containing protein [Gammaproteobacteria bacterium]MBU4003244.1 HEAT repeat domain-containing protein [Gammaproteobacteria bacterium]MBU4022293.1 HEAT repeat domain-containing protein [Gammaproteobacteria bacterium]